MATKAPTRGTSKTSANIFVMKGKPGARVTRMLVERKLDIIIDKSMTARLGNAHEQCISKLDIIIDESMTARLGDVHKQSMAVSSAMIFMGLVFTFPGADRLPLENLAIEAIKSMEMKPEKTSAAPSRREITMTPMKRVIEFKPRPDIPFIRASYTCSGIDGRSVLEFALVEE